VPCIHEADARVQFIKRSNRKAPRVSLVLLDWSVRESFHILHYLARQSLPRDQFEVVVVEYYSRISEAVEKYSDQVDTWVLLNMPDDCYYHKHLMLNVGMVLAKGEIVAIGDSDAMVRETFLQRISYHFDREPKSVFHIDQFRNIRRDFYPFNYPSFEDVSGPGCVNNSGGKTSGIVEAVDPIHSRNYGACMCAPRRDLIAIGGADEYVDFLGHICGPYDMTFRLTNAGYSEFWAEDEFSYHTWHPGQAGEGNYLGPHDGRHMSTTSLLALASGRVLPLKENAAIRVLRTGETADESVLISKLIDPLASDRWRKSGLLDMARRREATDRRALIGFHRGARLYQEGNSIKAEWIGIDPLLGIDVADKNSLSQADFGDIAEAKQAINSRLPLTVCRLLKVHGWLFSMLRMGGLGLQAVRRLPRLSLRKLMHVSGFLERRATEGETMSSDGASLVAYLAGKRGWPASPLVIVPDTAQALALRILVFLGSLPKLAVLKICDRDLLVDRLRHAKEEGRIVIVSSLTYAWNYSVFAAFREEDLVVV
jgi:hypothetical protein